MGKPLIIMYEEIFKNFMTIHLTEADLHSIICEAVNNILREDRYTTTATPYNSMADRAKSLGRNPLIADNGGHSNNDVVAQVSTFDTNGENFKSKENICVSDNKFTIYKIKNFGNDKIESTKSLFGGSSKELRRAIDSLNGGAQRGGKHIIYRTITSQSNKAKSERSDHMVGTFWEFSLNHGGNWYLLVPDPLMKMKESKFVNKLAESIIREAADDSFSLQELSSIRSFAKRMAYCKQHLGQTIGRGSSRAVFQIDDDKCLKLAMNNKGIAQNGAENDWYKDKLGCFPHIIETTDDNSWIVMEYVLPAKEQDFQQCLGMTWKEFQQFINSAFYYTKGNDVRRSIYMPIERERLDKMIEDNEDLYSIYEFIGNYDAGRGDLLRLASYGMALRNGEPTIVILDHGLTDDIYNDYYRRR